MNKERKIKNRGLAFQAKRKEKSKNVAVRNGRQTKEMRKTQALTSGLEPNPGESPVAAFRKWLHEMVAADPGLVRYMTCPAPRSVPKRGQKPDKYMIRNNRIQPVGRMRIWQSSDGKPVFWVEFTDSPKVHFVVDGTKTPVQSVHGVCLYMRKLLLLAGVEPNPGPKKLARMTQNDYFSRGEKCAYEGQVVQGQVIKTTKYRRRTLICQACGVELSVTDPSDNKGEHPTIPGNMRIF